MTYDRWGATETVEIFNHLGLQTTYTKRYHLSDKKIDTSSLKGKLAYCAQELKKCLHPWQKASKANYIVQFVSTIDDEVYEFMKAHRKNDLWLREMEMLNWIVEYPFLKGGKRKVEGGRQCFFGDDAKVYEYKVAKVYVGEELPGVYILRQHDDELSIVYLYYTFEKREVVFDAIIDYVIANRPKSFVTENEYLCERVRERLYFPKTEEERVSLSLPEIKGACTMQLGDGDSFA